MLREPADLELLPAEEEIMAMGAEPTPKLGRAGGGLG